MVDRELAVSLNQLVWLVVVIFYFHNTAHSMHQVAPDPPEIALYELAMVSRLVSWRTCGCANVM